MITEDKKKVSRYRLWMGSRRYHKNGFILAEVLSAMIIVILLGAVMLKGFQISWQLNEKGNQLQQQLQRIEADIVFGEDPEASTPVLLKIEEWEYAWSVQIDYYQKKQLIIPIIRGTDE